MKRLLLIAFFVLLAPLADAAFTTRYFGTTGAGAADGTTWADRAALFSSGNLSTVITGHDFATSGLLCYVGPGTHSQTQSIDNTAITTDPAAAFPLFMAGCDSSGNPLAPPDPKWMSTQTPWDDSALPVIAMTANTTSVGASNIHLFMLKFTSSGRTGGNVFQFSGNSSADWCVIENSSSGTSAGGVGSASLLSNSVVYMTGTSYNYGVNASFTVNCRVVKTGSTSTSGSRNGIAGSTGSTRCTVVGHAGDGLASSASNVVISRNTVSNNGGSGIVLTGTNTHYVIGNLLTGNGAYGINASDRATFIHNRTRDNTTAATTGFTEYSGSIDLYTTDTDDATEFVNAASGDYTLKSTAATWGKGYSAGEEVPTGTTGGGSYTFAQ